MFFLGFLIAFISCVNVSLDAKENPEFSKEASLNERGGVFVSKTSLPAFDREVLRYSGKVLVKVTADWCGFCRRMKPVDEKLAQEFAAKVKFVIVQADKIDKGVVTTFKNEMNISHYPTYMYFSNGKLVKSIPPHGSCSELEMRANLNKLIAENTRN